MPPRPAIHHLPEDIRRELDSRLIGSAFGGYEGVAQWLADKGYSISHSAVGRYGKKLHDRYEQLRLVTDQARSLVEASPDEEGAVNEATLRLAQERLFTLLLECDDDGKEIDAATISRITRAASDIARASDTQQRRVERVRREMAERAAKAAKEAGKVMADAGLDKAAADKIKALFWGLAPAE